MARTEVRCRTNSSTVLNLSPPASGEQQNAKTIIWRTRCSQFVLSIYNLVLEVMSAGECVAHTLAANFEMFLSPFVTVVHSTSLVYKTPAQRNISVEISGNPHGPDASFL